MSTALIVIGLIGLISGSVLLIVTAIRRRFRRTWKRWTAITLGGLAMLIVGSFTFEAPAKFEVNSCIAEPCEVMVGESVTITAEIENAGGKQGAYQAVLLVDGEEQDIKTVTLAPKEFRVISFEIFEDAPGIHEVTVGQQIASFEVLTVPSFEVHSYSIQPSEVKCGESITVEATIENMGATDGVYQIALSIDGIEEETKGVTLAAGEEKTVSFVVTMETSGVHEIELGPLTDIVTVLELEPAQFKLFGLNISPNPAKVGQETTASIDIENEGEEEGTYPISLILDDITIETMEITLAGGDARTVTFPIIEEEAGSYNVKIADQEAILQVVEPVRLNTGTFIVKDLYGGKAKLTVENGLDLDAVVILSLTEEPDTSLVAVYIQADDSYTIKRIKGGTYILYFCLGKDWDESSNQFMTDASYKRFEDDIKFVSSSSRYSVVTVTLHPVAGGTAGTELLSEGEFPEL